MPGSLHTLYHRLCDHFGTQPEWWPIFGSDAPFEMLLGAVLVQQTRWEMVEQAILNLRAAGLLTPASLAQADADALAEQIKPVAFYRQKARGLIAICAYLTSHYQGNTAALLAQPTATLRPELLALPRIGPETADVMLLYAGGDAAGHTVFVVDDYTRRLFGRVQPELHSAASTATERQPAPDWQRLKYEQLRSLLEAELAPAADTPPQQVRQFYADYHALINEICVRYCLARRPRCDGPPARRVYSRQAGRESYLTRHDGCPLRAVCAFYQASANKADNEPAG
jgi:endonuclease-3 related protein